MKKFKVIQFEFNESDVSQIVTCILSRVWRSASTSHSIQFAISHKMSQTSLDIHTALYIDTLQSQSLHDRSLEVNMDAVKDASVSIYKVLYLGNHSGHNPS